MSAWKPSHREEVISALWLIAAFQSLSAGCPRWVFFALFIKAGLDSCCAIRCCIREWREEEVQKRQITHQDPKASAPAEPS